MRSGTVIPPGEATGRAPGTRRPGRSTAVALGEPCHEVAEAVALVRLAGEVEALLAAPGRLAAMAAAAKAAARPHAADEIAALAEAHARG